MLLWKKKLRQREAIHTNLVLWHPELVEKLGQGRLEEILRSTGADLKHEET